MRVRHDLSDFLASFSTLSFRIEDTVRFRYRMLGLGDAWMETDSAGERYRYHLGPYRKHRGHTKEVHRSVSGVVAAVVSIRRDEGSLFGLARSCYAF